MYLLKRIVLYVSWTLFSEFLKQVSYHVVQKLNSNLLIIWISDTYSIDQTKNRNSVEHWKALTKEIECLHYVLLNFAKHFIS